MRPRTSAMHEEDLQPGGDRFPPTRRSVIEAVAALKRKKANARSNFFAQPTGSPFTNTSACAGSGPRTKRRI